MKVNKIKLLVYQIRKNLLSLLKLYIYSKVWIDWRPNLNIVQSRIQVVFNELKLHLLIPQTGTYTYSVCEAIG